MNNETIAMLIQFFNMQVGAKCRANNEANQKVVSEVLEMMNDNIVEFKNKIRVWAKEHPGAMSVPNVLNNCMDDIARDIHHAAPVPTTTPVASAPTEQAVSNSLGILEQALIEVIKNQSVPKIEADIKDSCTKLLQDFIKSEYGTIERKITTVINGEHKDVKGILHEKFDTVLKFVANDEPVFLTGPAGSGKNYICKQVAEALGLKFYFTNAVTQEYKLTGFTDANGNYQPTQFYKAFTEGGVFMLDEMDASIPEVLVILNAAIANRYFDFPAPIGYVEAHPDFRIIAAGNTTGHGADYEYVGRNQLDAASLDRFAIVHIDYSVQIENGVAGDIEVADFCRAFRKAANKTGIQVIVSYRAIGRLAKMIQLLDLTEALQTCLVKGLEKDDLNIICNELPDSKYKDALRRCA